MADPKHDVKTTEPVAVAPTAADQAVELARLRARVQELEARETFVQLPGSAITEVFAGMEDYEGEQRDTWHYRIDLPASGGADLSINGHRFYHGQTYKVSTDTLRTLKDQVARAWGHEANISGSNENFYRREKATRIGTRA